MQEQNEDIVSASQFAAFVIYMRRMLADIAAARTGEYSTTLGIGEIAVVWNPVAENPLEGHPRPHDITHIRAEPYACPVDLGQYAFKAVLHAIMAQAGYERTPDYSFVSEMKEGQYSFNLGGGCDETGADQINYILIRSRRSFAQAIDSIKNTSDEQLADHCLRALTGLRLVVAPLPQGRADFPAPAI